MQLCPAGKPKRLFLVCALVAFFCVAFTPLSFAQVGGIGPGEVPATNPKTRTEVVTLTIKDTIPPTVPILVAPADTSTVVTTTPTFIWQPSTDYQGIGKYQLILDGNVLFDNIPTGSTTNSSYTLIVEDGEMKLTPSASLTQGLHTWSIVAFDTSNNTASSATWSFTVDTQAPVTVVTSIGTASVSISSNNPNSVPTNPVTLTANQPAISGTSEDGANLQLTVSIPSQANQVFTTHMVGNNFSFQLGFLPTDVVMHFTLVSSDAIGNTSIINNVPFTIPSSVIVIPTPTASPAPGTTPTPTPGPGETPAPTSTPLAIPLPLPIQQPKPIQQLITSSPLLQQILNNPIVQEIAKLGPAISAAAPVLVATAASVETGASFLTPLLEIISRLLQSLGLLPLKRPRGVVFDTKNGKPVPFARISIMKAENEEAIDTVVSDVDGIYRSIKLPIGSYKMSATHQDYRFPTVLKPRLLVNPHDFYRGEVFHIDRNNQEELFLIPMDPIFKEDAKRQHLFFKVAIAFLRRLVFNLFYPAAIFSFVVALFFPTRWNLFVVAIYVVLILWRWRHNNKEPLLIGTVRTKDGPLPDVLVRCVETGSNQLDALLMTDSQGRFRVNLAPHAYTLSFVKQGYLVPSDEASYSAVYVDHKKQKQTISVVMATVDEVLKANQ